MIHHQLQPLIEAPITDLKAQKKYMIENIQYMNKEIKSLTGKKESVERELKVYFQFFKIIISDLNISIYLE